MALVHVIDLRMDAEGVQGSHAAYPEDDLLPDPHLQITAIKLFRDQTVFGRILLDIRIEQIEFDPADLELPDLRRDAPAKNGDVNVKRLISDFGFPQRQMIEVLVEAHSLLPTILVDLLLEVTVAVQQRHRAEIRGQGRSPICNDRRKEFQDRRNSSARIRGTRTPPKNRRCAARLLGVFHKCRPGPCRP